MIYTLPKGSYSEKAAKEFLKFLDGEYEIGYCNNIYEIFEKIDRSSLGVVPIENSIEGSVSLTLDLLLEFDVKILAEISLDIHHCLIGYDKEKIKIILSHPQALAQCRKYIKKHGWEVKAVESTIKAVELIEDERYGAIADRDVVKYYKHLKILDENIEDYKNNKTRFILIGYKKVKFKKEFKKYKTSIIFELKEDKPGALYHVLKEFAERGINLTRIESRPSKRRLGTYIFYIDYENGLEVLNSVKKHTTFIKVLGRYPVLVE
ncbi:prephenate dehydratase [Methanocaldococcus villosus KIN24-T80]|uniref:Prephenate dehydratase n=1 Tax=Methanocaldococcus villosus KIN24-T80 TaxID=1069083 RepID=N6VQ32_9EURY|nr:prephenate dehydratase [Methanocaldococcus villosus]ENN95995.1 prephenate dehydratase [Methanocaldococcus villosus KIN24-T80]